MIKLTLRKFEDGLNGWEVTIESKGERDQHFQCKSYVCSTTPGWIELNGLEGMSTANSFLRYDLITIYG